VRYSCLKILPLEEVCINIEKRLLLEEEIVRYLSVSLSLSLSRNEKIEQLIKKKEELHT